MSSRRTNVQSETRELGLAFGKALTDLVSHGFRRQLKQSSGHRHHQPRVPVELELNRSVAGSRTVPQSLPPASAGQGLNAIATYASHGDGSGKIGDNSGLVAVTDGHGNSDEQRTGAEISSAALGQGNQAARVHFYTGMMVVQCQMHR